MNTTTVTEFFMILIMQAPGGDLSGAFAVQQGLDQCDARRPAIAAVVEASGTTVVESFCAAGSCRFSPYILGTEATGASVNVTVYRVSIDRNDASVVSIALMGSRSACESIPAQHDWRAYCVFSRQRLRGAESTWSMLKRSVAGWFSR